MSRSHSAFHVMTIRCNKSVSSNVSIKSNRQPTKVPSNHSSEILRFHLQPLSQRLRRKREKNSSGITRKHYYNNQHKNGLKKEKNTAPLLRKHLTNKIVFPHKRSLDILVKYFHRCFFLVFFFLSSEHRLAWCYGLVPASRRVCCVGPFRLLPAPPRGRRCNGRRIRRVDARRNSC